MHNYLSELIAPHYCCSCGEIGAILCEYCKYDIVSNPFSSCILCRAPTSVNGMLCGSCKPPYTKAWCVGEKRDGLEKLIDAHKFERAKRASGSMAALLDDIVPRLPEHVIIVPVPTLAAHVRQRGYDHMVLLAKAFAAIRELQSKSLLSRRTATSQRGASRVVRMHQAEQAFSCAPLQGGIYVLLDDVLTTGATAEHAARALLAAGADEVWLAIIARQPLEK